MEEKNTASTIIKRELARFGETLSSYSVLKHANE
jgi:hypothetical protein